MVSPFQLQQVGGVQGRTALAAAPERAGQRDPWQLYRFVDAQSLVYPAVCAELTAGRKDSHWMWFVFPQLKGLGRSPTAQHFGISGVEEARAYRAHPLLGRRLEHCASLLLGVRGRSALEIFGSPDDLKLKSCMTLFATVAPEATVFATVLERYFQGEEDAATLRLLGRPDRADGLQ